MRNQGKPVSKTPVELPRQCTEATVSWAALFIGFNELYPNMSLDRQQTNRDGGVEDPKREPLPQLSQLQSSSTSTSEVTTFLKPFSGLKQALKIWLILILCGLQSIHSEKTPSFKNVRSKIGEPVVAAFIAGGVAGAVSRTIVSPLERLKILLQIQSVGREEYKLSIWKALVKMWREEGWRGFMRGNGTNCIRIVPYSAVQFGSYNLYKKVSRRPINASGKCVNT